MDIIPIFEPHLYAFRYPTERKDELERIFELWNDIEFLEDFFELNKSDLAYYGVGVDEAINETYKEAKAFQKKLLELSNMLKPQLDTIFRNLDNQDFRLYELAKQKSRRRWLRFYAIRIDSNVYVITGGAIKLTRNMEDKPHTKEELEKLSVCRDYLLTNNVYDDDSFKELICEKL